jgi:KRAB domain-containing zinc finger protein
MDANVFLSSLNEAQLSIEKLIQNAFDCILAKLNILKTIKPNIACKKCSLKFKTLRELTVHSQAKHKRGHINTLRFSCIKCERKFMHKCNLELHLRMHSGEKPFVCNVCGREFARSNNLNVHMRIHLGDKPFACQLCGKKFTVSNNLTVHMRTHTGEKPYACNQCRKEIYWLK